MEVNILPVRMRRSGSGKNSKKFLGRSSKTCKLTESCSGDLTTDERDDYIKAVKCLMSSPSKLSSTHYPGAKTRYDDFVVVHMNMTPSVHATVGDILGLRTNRNTDMLAYRQVS
jgi:hypothetical protein